MKVLELNFIERAVDKTAEASPEAMIVSCGLSIGRKYLLFNVTQELLVLGIPAQYNGDD